MEKYSAYRDPATGIQPFLTPVPPIGSRAFANATLPIAYFLGVIRTILALILGLVYVLIVEGVCLVFTPIPPLHRLVTRILSFILLRTILFVVGILWIPVEIVTSKRSFRKSGGSIDTWAPGPGDIIVSNWVSWIEIVWLAATYNPIFVIPAVDTVELIDPTAQKSNPITGTPGRRTGTGSANISSPKRVSIPKIPITGFQQVSLGTMLAVTGHVPTTAVRKTASLEEIRRKASRPLVVFPECTTSNGRGLLRFADIFRGVAVPVKAFNVFVMCFRYDPPTPLTPTISLSVPSNTLNPLSHLFTLCTALKPQPVSVRLLSTAESPSSPLFMVNEVVTDIPSGRSADLLSEACAVLIAQIGKMKRVGMGWEDKATFLRFYRDTKR